MPQTQKPKVAHFDIKIRLEPLLRRVLSFWPYFVGNQVKYKLQIVDPESRWDATSLQLFEIFHGEESRLAKYEPVEINDGWKEVIGNPIDGQGDVIYKIGTSRSSAKTIITAYAVNTDRWAIGCVSFIAGIVATEIAGLILGFIKIHPAWEVWLPFFFP